MITDQSVATDDEPVPSSEVEPTFAQGLILLVIYGVIVVGGQLLSGVDYDAISANAGNAFKAIVVPVALGVLAVLAVGWRWGIRSIWHERSDLRLSSPRWLLSLVLFLFLLSIVLGIGLAPWGDWSAGVVLLILAGTLMVGFGEEIIFRGFLLVGARQRYSELGTLLLTCTLFGLIHGANFLNGQAAGMTIRQVLSAAFMGAAFYLIRRFTGYLVVAMLVHGLLDFSILVGAGPGDGGADVTSAISGLPASIGLIVTIITVIIVFRRSRAGEAAGTSNAA
jgi:membrane protease YdiL (CAAX protease family)